MIRYVAAASMAAAAISIEATGCGPRDLDIVVTAQGMGFVLDACLASSNGAKCLLDGNPVVSATTLKTALQARLFLADATGAVRAASACFELLPSSVQNPSGDPAAWGDGMANELNQELEGALPNGLTYPGLRDPSEVILTLALYDPTHTGGQCVKDALIVCAGFEQPLVGGAYDISCASCQGGPAGSMGAHCPTAGTTCFLEECARVVGSLP